MKVITGTARGTKLLSPKGSDTRPTSGLVKGALFNIIGEMVFGCRFLDLFAGTGAVGIEALSRGALYSVFVDSSPVCVDIIRQNLEKTRLGDKGKIYCADAIIAMRSIAREGYKFNCVFIDPPYGRPKDFFTQCLTAAAEYDIFREDCVIITERKKKEGRLDFAEQGFRCSSSRVYSGSRIDFYERIEKAEAEG